MDSKAAGLHVYFKEYLEDGASLREGLSAVFQETPAGLTWTGFDCELVQKDADMALVPGLSSRELAEILGNRESLLVCGRFFCYPKEAHGEAVTTLPQFEAGPCETIILVYDVAFVEIYSKDEAYLARCRRRLRALAAPPEMEEIDAASCPRKAFLI